MSNENKTPQEKADELFIECYPNDLDNGKFMKSCWARLYAVKICDAILTETLEEYTNDENHVRVEYWNEVKRELKEMKF